MPAIAGACSIARRSAWRCAAARSMLPVSRRVRRSASSACAITIGDLLRWMVLIGSRVAPAGRSSARLNSRRRISRRPGRTARDGSCARSQTISSFLLVGCGASGQTTRQAAALDAVHARHMQERLACAAARFASRRSPRACCACAGRSPTAAAGAVLTSRASAIVARTSDSASCAASCARPLAAVRCSSLNDGRPSSCVGQTMPSGRSAWRAAQHVEQIPAAAFVLPLARIRVDQVAPEQEARHLVVEADAVVAHADGARATPARPRSRRRRRARRRPSARQCCGRMPVSRQASGSGR